MTDSCLYYFEYTTVRTVSAFLLLSETFLRVKCVSCPLAGQRPDRDYSSGGSVRQEAAGLQQTGTESISWSCEGASHSFTDTTGLTV